eukprot:jgi/Tetstr1/439723/TSEL_028142.t1
MRRQHPRSSSAASSATSGTAQQAPRSAKKSARKAAHLRNAAAQDSDAPEAWTAMTLLCRPRLVFGVLTAAALLILRSSGQSCDSLYGYQVVRSFPHDHTAFTQGLEFERICDGGGGGQPACRDVLWESTGMYGASTVRKVDLQTGEVLAQHRLGRTDFGEGLVKDASGRLVQLLWRTGKTYTYDPATLEQIGTHDTGLRDGWGIATDGAVLYVTDSSTQLHTVSAETLQVTGSREITWKGTPVPWVNELEWIDGELWGNIWQTECIARINPSTAEVTSWVLMDGLTQRTNRAQTPRMDVLNGIAWDAMNRRLFLTGKYWPKLYEVALVKKPCAEANSLGAAIPSSSALRG